MKTEQIRQKYFDYFKQRNHALIPSASLIPENDPSSLFTSSGMQPLIPYLMGEKHPEGTRLVDIQKSFRSGDIEEVGDNRHTTCFEMMGNWSLGDYFKDEQLSWFFEFLTKELELDPERLYVSVFSGNKEIGIEKDMKSVEIWQKLFKQHDIEAIDVEDAEEKGMQGGRIFYYDENKNWWSRSGAPANMPIGEIGGPDSEVFYDMGADLKRHENSKWKDEPCHINCDCGRYIEVGNSVFIEFIKTKNGFEALPQKNVDFGGGLERLAMIKQGKTNIFETDLYINALNKIEELSGGKKYKDNMHAFEVIADHLKGATFIMGDDKGIVPANTDQGYIVRRLIRRAIRYGLQLGITQKSWTKEIAKIISNTYSEAYPEIGRNIDFVMDNLSAEEAKFSKTLHKGLRIIEKYTGQNKDISGKEAFNIYQTYGFPLEMTEEEVAKKGLRVLKIEQFNEELKKHQELSRTAAAGKFKGGLADSSEATTKLHTAAHLLLASLRKVLGEHIMQKGSNITAERLRFDFSHPEKLSDEQKQEVERLVNEAIKNNLAVSFVEMPLDRAKEQGVVGVFESKYGEKVKVYQIGEGENIFSREICGGPHVANIGNLGTFKIIKEKSSSAGVRRIKAVLEG